MLLNQSATSSAPAALKLAMGKMSLFCTARNGIPPGPSGFFTGSFLRDFPRSLYTARWALAAAGLSLAAAMLVSTGYQKMQSQNALPNSPAVRVADASHR
jgi:hypothetical protein